MEVSLATLAPTLPEDLRNLVRTALGAVLALATRAANSSSDSNSLGGILIRSEPLPEAMPAMKPRRSYPIITLPVAELWDTHRHWQESYPAFGEVEAGMIMAHQGT